MPFSSLKQLFSYRTSRIPIHGQPLEDSGTCVFQSHSTTMEASTLSCRTMGKEFNFTEWDQNNPNSFINQKELWKIGIPPEEAGEPALNISCTNQNHAKYIALHEYSLGKLHSKLYGEDLSDEEVLKRYPATHMPSHNEYLKNGGSGSFEDEEFLINPEKKDPSEKTKKPHIIRRALRRIFKNVHRNFHLLQMRNISRSVGRINEAFSHNEEE